MRLALFLIFLSIPLIELALLIKLGQVLGFWPTFAMVIGSAFLGATVLHRQGLSTLQRAAAMTQRGKPPLEPAIDGVFLFMAGILLLTPGLITDVAGLLLLIPPVRRIVAHWGFNRLMRFATFEMHVSRGPSRRQAQPASPQAPNENAPRKPRPRQNAQSNSEGPVIEGDYERIDERDRPKQ